MKKTIFSIIFLVALFSLSSTSFAQSLTAVKNKAISATRQAGYITGYSGRVVGSVTQIGTCGTTTSRKKKYEVFVSPKSTPTTRVAPFALVTMCGTAVLSIENLRQ